MFPWRIWSAAAAIAVIIFSFTLTAAVPVWLDEALIVEYGRVTLAGEAPVYGFLQRSDSNRPMYSYALIGAVLQEIAYRATAPSNAGPRAVALLGQLLAFGWFVYYLRLRGVQTNFSVLLGLAFLTDPLCDISWRGARIDGWAFAFLFASLCAIRTARDRPRGDRSASGVVFLSGAAAAAGLLCWPSFAMLLPLVALEFGALLWKQRRFVLPASLFAAGAVLIAVAIIMPFRREFTYGIADARLVTLLRSQASQGAGFGRQLQALLLSLAQTPAVAVVGLCALARKRNRPLMGGFVVALAFTLGTMVYRLRVLYLVPYLYLAVASLFWPGDQSADCLRWRRAGVWALALLLSTGTAFTVAGTTLSGLTDRSGKNPLALIEPARSAVGSGPVRVFMEEPDLYFAGRALGWRQFHCFDGCASPELSTPAYQRLLANTDVIIWRGEPDAVTRGVLEESGFRFATVMLPEGGRRSALFDLSYGPPAYGPYFIYRRPGISHASP